MTLIISCPYEGHSRLKEQHIEKPTTIYHYRWFQLFSRYSMTFFFLSQALLLPLRVQRLPVVINFNCVAKAAAQTHSQRVHNDPFSHSTFGHCCRADTRAHAHKHPHTGKIGESKGVFVTATFISFSLMALHTETHLQKCTVRTEQQARLLFFCDSTLLRSSLAGVRLLSEGGPSTVHGWYYGLVMKVLVEGSGQWEESPLQMDTVLSWLGSVEKDFVFEVKSGNGNLAKCLIDLKASRGRERKEERRKEFRGFLQMAANYAVWFGPCIDHHPHRCQNTL